VTACTDATRSLRLTVDGLPAALAVRSSAARTLAGQAGLPTLRLECSLTAPASVTSGAVAVRLTDTGAGDEVGWREMTARGDGTTLARSDVPRRTQSARLTAYPKDLLTSPLDVRSLRLSVTPGGPRLGPDSPTEAAPAAGLTRGADRSALLVLLGAVALGHAWFGVALVVAFGLGMAATLAVVGLVVMRLRERAEERLRTHPASRFAPLLRIAPPLTAVAVVLLGAALGWRGFGATGLL
jgi:hypothetical protein